MKQTTDILIISEDEISGNTGTSLLINFLFSELNKYKISQLSLDRNSNINFNISEYIKKYPKNNNHKIKEDLRNLKIINKILIGNPSSLSILKNYIKIKNIVKEKNPKIIYTTLGCGALNKLVYKLSIDLNIPIITHIMDDWIDSKNTHGIIGFLHGLYIRYYFKKILKKSKKILVISEGMAREYKKRYQISAEVICNSCYINYSIKKLKNKDYFKIGYVGSYSDQSQKDGLLDLAEALKNEQYYKIEYWINQQSYEKCINSFKYNNQKNLNIFLAPKDNKQYANLISSFDLLFMPSSFESSRMNYVKFSMPAKLPSYLISGVPILFYGDKNNEQIKLVTKYNAGYKLINKSINSLSNKINYIKNNLNNDEIIKNQMKLYEKKFNPFKIKENFKKIIELNL